jgi:ribonuclease P protein component
MHTNGTREIKHNKRPTQLSRQQAFFLFKNAKILLKDPLLVIKGTTISEDTFQCLIIIPKAVGNAVKRNRIRRKIKAALYPYISHLKGYGLLFFAKSGIDRLTYHDFNHILSHIAQRIQML